MGEVKMWLCGLDLGDREARSASCFCDTRCCLVNAGWKSWYELDYNLLESMMLCTSIERRKSTLNGKEEGHGNGSLVPKP